MNTAQQQKKLMQDAEKLVIPAWQMLAKLKTIHTHEHGDCFKAVDVLRALRMVAMEAINNNTKQEK